MKLVVIDASVALKWVLNDEEHVAEASALLLDQRAGLLELHAPELLGYEFSNVLWVASRQGRITPANARAAIQLFRQLGILYHPLADVWDDAVNLAFQYQRSVYDSAYVALAQRLGVWLFTGDRRLHNALSPHLNCVRWIGDYQYESIP